ncbi:MAG: hypothetical protein L0H84_12435 [Pseudonocardia sp.]|nr:hypothetical protein [Pseudonocardia sp.]
MAERQAKAEGRRRGVQRSLIISTSGWRETRQLGEETVNLLLQRRPGQGRLVDPQRQRTQDGGSQVECNLNRITGGLERTVHAALYRCCGVGEEDLLQRASAGRAFVHHFEEPRKRVHVDADLLVGAVDDGPRDWLAPAAGASDASEDGLQNVFAQGE